MTRTREENALERAEHEGFFGPDSDLSAEQLDDKYNPDGDGQHPEHTREEWIGDVFQGHTLVGYWQWVVKQIEETE